MSAEKRRSAILQASLPLFARRGHHGVTTLELAAACGVSEALLFRHFPTKQAMFDAIQLQHVSEVKPGHPDINHTAPYSTEELVRLVCLFVHYVVFTNATDDHEVMRLFYRSFVEDGNFARAFLSSKRVQKVKTDFVAGLVAARASGDARPLPVDPQNLFWFVQHATTAACLMRIPAQPVVRYRGPLKVAIHDLVRFALRGIGLTEEAIARHATNEHFDRWLAVR
jgi:AcrR family transcriptional regulator